MDEKELKEEELGSVGGGQDSLAAVRETGAAPTAAEEGGEADTRNLYRFDIRTGIPQQQKKTNS